MARIETEKLLIRLAEHELNKRKAAGTYKGGWVGGWAGWSQGAWVGGSDTALCEWWLAGWLAG